MEFSLSYVVCGLTENLAEKGGGRCRIVQEIAGRQDKIIPKNTAKNGVLAT
jgi:hypothetical protein